MGLEWFIIFLYPIPPFILKFPQLFPKTSKSKIKTKPHPKVGSADTQLIYFNLVPRILIGNHDC